MPVSVLGTGGIDLNRTNVGLTPLGHILVWKKILNTHTSRIRTHQKGEAFKQQLKRGIQARLDVGKAPRLSNRPKR